MGSMAEVIKRRENVAHLHFSRGWTQVKVAEVLGVNERTIARDVSELKKTMRNEITQEISVGQRLMTSLLEIVHSSKERKRILWDKYNSVNSNFTTLIQALRDKDGGAVRTSRSNAEAILSLNSDLKQSLAESRREEKHLMEALKNYGIIEEVSKVEFQGIVMGLSPDILRDMAIEFAKSITERVTDAEIRELILGDFRRTIGKHKETIALLEESEVVDVEGTEEIDGPDANNI